MKRDYITNDEKLEVIQDIVNGLYAHVDGSSFVYSELMLIDSICDVPLVKETWND